MQRDIRVDEILDLPECARERSSVSTLSTPSSIGETQLVHVQPGGEFFLYVPEYDCGALFRTIPSGALPPSPPDPSALGNA